ncbi:hypothetical protein EJ04DRAFT_519192 [Polyplosphaeria fusca]|uniref:Uncharacterized protein n=1 Tax=Polyplosphaeria fusca TaxID=682080 RepID=A0A9P4R8C6_9PLEO|nr:hypothetical protein EJ04DRAFT_519192 [Polyplosphaeria fusca]
MVFICTPSLLVLLSLLPTLTTAHLSQTTIATATHTHTHTDRQIFEANHILKFLVHKPSTPPSPCHPRAPQTTKYIASTFTTNHQLKDLQQPRNPTQPHQQTHRYHSVPRPWQNPNPAALNSSCSSGSGKATSTTTTTAHTQHPGGQASSSQGLTSAGLAQHDRQNRRTWAMREWMREGQREGFWNGVGEFTTHLPYSRARVMDILKRFTAVHSREEKSLSSVDMPNGAVQVPKDSRASTRRPKTCRAKWASASCTVPRTPQRPYAHSQRPSADPSRPLAHDTEPQPTQPLRPCSPCTEIAHDDAQTPKRTRRPRAVRRRAPKGQNPQTGPPHAQIPSRRPPCSRFDDGGAHPLTRAPGSSRVPGPGDGRRALWLAEAR